MTTDNLIGIVAGLIAGICTLAISKIATSKARNELFSEARMEIEDARSQDGYDAPSFLRRERHPVMISEEETERRELRVTVAGELLLKMNRFIWRVSFIVAVLVTIIVIVLRTIGEID